MSHLALERVGPLSESTNRAAEGETVTYTVTANGAVNEETSLTVSVVGSDLDGAATAATADDFEVSDTSVTFEEGAEDGATKTFTVTAKSDTVAEGLEGVKVSLLDDNFNTVASETTAITNVEPVQTFDLSASEAAVDEGGTVTFTLETTNVDAGTQFAYNLSGVSGADVEGELAGAATVDSQGKATVAVNLLEDERTEGAETLKLEVAGETAEVTVNDTSVTPEPETFTLTAADVSINLIRAWACGLRSTRPTSMPGADMSAPKRARPVTLSIPSGRGGRVPTTLNSIFAVSVLLSSAITMPPAYPWPRPERRG